MGKIKSFLKKHKKKIIGVVALLVILIGVKSMFFKGNTNENILPLEDTTLLTKKDFKESVTENGIVKSETTSQVYAQKTLPVKEIFVKVGDTVKEGDIIASLDSSSIEQQLATRSAAVSQSSKTANAQIKNAQDRLNEAIKNKENGTNSQIVAATNALTSAYDAWQGAEKAYEDYKRSLEEGYNAEINASNSSMTQLENSKKSSELNLNQAREKLSKIQSDMSNSYDMANRKNMELRDLKNRDNFISSRINDLNSQIQSLSNSGDNTPSIDVSYEKISEIDLKIQDLEREKLNVDETRKIELQNTIDGLKGEREELVKLIDKGSTNTPNSGVDINSLKRELETLQKESSDLKERIATVTADKSKYETEAETYSKQISSANQEIEQQSLAYEAADKNLAEGIKSNLNSDKLRQDQLKTLRKSADDLKNAYESAVKSLDVTKVGVDNEINSLKNALKLAEASKDTSSGVEIKYLKEDLAKTKVKSPISGTITENNLIIGQVPTDYVAKVETLNKKIVKSQIKEYDLNNITIGMEVEITSESLGKDKKYKGRVISINPTPIKVTGQDASGESKYETEISIENDGDNLIKAGMNVRVKYIIKEMKDVITVPTSSVYTKNSKDFVMIYSEKENMIKEVPVEVLAENEFESVVKGNDLKENIRVINSSDKYQSGMSITLGNDMEKSKANK